jgi:hypothetical protein
MSYLQISREDGLEFARIGEGPQEDVVIVGELCLDRERRDCKDELSLHLQESQRLMNYQLLPGLQQVELQRMEILLRQAVEQCIDTGL